MLPGLQLSWEMGTVHASKTTALRQAQGPDPLKLKSNNCTHGNPSVGLGQSSAWGKPVLSHLSASLTETLPWPGVPDRCQDKYNLAPNLITAATNRN